MGRVNPTSERWEGVAIRCESDKPADFKPVRNIHLRWYDHCKLGGHRDINPKSEIRMTNQIRNPKSEVNGRKALGSDFGLRASFGFRHSIFVIVQGLLMSAATES